MYILRGVVNWIAALESGNQFRKWVDILVKILGVLALIGAIVWGITICVYSIYGSDFLVTGSRTLVIIGSLLGLCINILVGLVLLMLFWNRSKIIRGLGDETHITLLPIAAILIRLFGEVGFLALVGAGIQGLVASIFGGNITNITSLTSLLMSDPLIGGNLSFIIGVLSLIVSVISGVILLISSYFVAEQISVFVDMATNLKKIETSLSTEEASSDSTEETPSDS